MDASNPKPEAPPTVAHGGEPDASTDPDDRHATVFATHAAEAAIGQRFVILRPHAAGGLGKVSVARDAELNREVALKELHDRHADDPQSRWRFLQEAEVTGGLEHPGIVPIYGLGRYADGRPFYAMRLIRGTSLADAIERFHAKADRHWMGGTTGRNLRRLLHRLIDACNAIEYAHSRGVLHRDIKPANIMLGQFGETLVVDWGLAKPLGCAGVDPFFEGSDLSPASFPEAVLKPQSGSGSAPTQIGAAVGTPAFMSPEQAAGRVDELGPTSDVYSLGATLYTIIAGRPPQTDQDLGAVLARVERGEFPAPREVNPSAPRGLEAICLKAMTLRPENRYASPRRLADDIDAWLADEPVSARREPLHARSWRWVRKHRTLVTGVAGVLVAALASTSVGVWRLNASNERERAAKEVAIGAKNAALAAEAEARRQVARNEELLALAERSLERYETLSQSDQLASYGMESLRIDLQEAALEYYTTLARQSGESQQARADRGHALYRLGSTYWQLGRFDDALAALQQSLDTFLKLQTEFPDDAAYRRATAHAYGGMGELMTENQRPAEGAAAMAEALRISAGLHQADPASLQDAVDLAGMHAIEGERLRQLGQMEAARDSFSRSVQLLRDATSLAPDEAMRIKVQFRLGRALAQLATLQWRGMWEFEKARGHYAETREVLEPIYEAKPELGDVGFSLAQVLRNLGSLSARENNVEAAREQLIAARDVLARVEDRYPEVPHYRLERADILHALGSLKHSFDASPASDEAVANLEEAAAIGRRLVERYPQQNDRRLRLAQYLGSLAFAYETRGRGPDAREQFQAAMALLDELSGQVGANVDMLYTIGTAQHAVGKLLAASKRHDDALAMFAKAEETLTRLVQLAPRLGEGHAALANVYLERGRSLESQGRLVDAIVELDRIVIKSREIAQLATAPWMKTLANSISLVASVARGNCLSKVREGELFALADRGEYEAAAAQARRLLEVSHEPIDHYAAARTLAYAAAKVAANHQLAQAVHARLVEQLAADAVVQLTAAWERGYIQRDRSAGSWFNAGPTLADVRAAPEFAALLEREDFIALVKRIETEQPPAPHQEQEPAGQGGLGDRIEGLLEGAGAP